MPTNGNRPQRLRSQLWFDNPDNPGMTALYLERYLNYGLTKQELTSGKPIVGIAQSGSDLSPCNRHHLELASRVREGIHDAGGIAFEFPMHPIQETGKRPTAALDRNLAYLSLVEVLFGYPLDGVVLTTGCDKTTPAAIMAAATMNTLAEALGLSLPGCAAIPAPYRERGQIAYETGRRAVEVVREDVKPSDILTREAFENAIVACSAIGGSTNAPIHINAIARHVGVALSMEDWEAVGYDVPLIVNMQPAGKYLGEEYYRAGGLPAVMRQLFKAGKG